MLDITGNRYGRLTVIREVERIRYASGNSHRVWECLCDCGNIIRCTTDRLRRGNTKSCGCLRKEITSKKNYKHGGTKTKLYRIWDEMNGRCFCKTNKAYKNYGARGIRVCDEWRKNFSLFRSWALSNGYQEGLTIERIDNNGNYCPDNCKWIPKSEQPKNRRNCHLITFNGKTQTLSEWSRELHVDRECVRNKEKILGDWTLALEAVLNSPKHKERVKIKNDDN